MNTDLGTKNKTWNELSKSEKFTGAVVLTALVALGIWGVATLTSAISGGKAPSSQGSVVEPAAHTDTEAYIDAQAIVEKTLKSPSTAKFPSSSNAVISRAGESVFNVKSYVDSQNGFGAMIRSEWSVMFEYVGDKVDVYAVSIDGETVYKKPGL